MGNCVEISSRKITPMEMFDSSCVFFIKANHRRQGFWIHGYWKIWILPAIDEVITIGALFYKYV